jgi:hypothetical protein
MERLFQTSPYERLMLDEVVPDKHGWGSDHPALRRCIEEIRPTMIAEVGVWKGRCVLNMFAYCRDAGIQAEILCIDTWLGSAEHWFNRSDPNFYDSLRIKNGLPQLYWTFLRNVVDAGAQGVITPMPMSSETAFHVLQRLRVSLDLVHVDAGHEYESVLSDLNRYWSLLRPGGVLIGDDYSPNWPGVVRSANDFANMINAQLEIEGAKYILRKSNAPV